jgi:Fur family transcriptional regulator, peroxide stress response regulator
MSNATCISVSSSACILLRSMRPPEKQQRIDRFFAAHRESGLPVTTQRRAVFEAILDRRDHPTAEQVYRAVRAGLPQISRMTVHRILGTFISLGLLSKTCHPGSSARFDPKLHQHHHLLCLACGEIFDVEDARLNRLPWPDVGHRGFQIEDYHVNFRGWCARCRHKLGISGAGHNCAPRLRIPRKQSQPRLKPTRV